MPYKSNDNAKDAAKKRMQRYRNKGVTRPVTPEPVTPYIADVTPGNVTPKPVNVTPVTPDHVTPVTPKNKPVKPCKNCIILQGQINKLQAVIASRKKVVPEDSAPICRHKLRYCRICG